MLADVERSTFYWTQLWNPVIILLCDWPKAVGKTHHTIFIECIEYISRSLQKTVLTVEVKTPVADASSAGAHRRHIYKVAWIVTPLICQKDRASFAGTSPVLHAAARDGDSPADDFSKVTQNNGKEHGTGDGETCANRPTRKAPLPPTSNLSMESEVTFSDSVIRSAQVCEPHLHRTLSTSLLQPRCIRTAASSCGTLWQL